MRNYVNRWVTVVLASTAVSCGSAGDRAEDVAAIRQNVQVPKTGSTAYPIQIDSTTYKPIIDPESGQPMSAWDGDYSTLIAADAYVQCIHKVAEFGPTTVALEPRLLGDALKRIEHPMSVSPCPRPDYTRLPDGQILYPPMQEEWANRRQATECNMNPSTGSNVAAFSLVQTDSTSPIAKLQDWMAADAGRVHAPLLTLMKGYVGLCIAERLNESLDDAQILASTSEEHMFLLATVQEQASSAAMKLGYAMKVFAKSDAPTSNVTQAELLRNWMDSDPDSVNKMMGDYLRSVRLVNLSTTRFATFLERQAGARWTTGSSSDSYERDWGTQSARSRLLSLVYGGGTLTDQWEESAWQENNAWFKRVKGATEDPRIDVLLNLARSANAIIVRKSDTDSNLDKMSGEQLYTEVELYLRLQDCQAKNNTCTRSQLLAQLPAPNEQVQYLLYHDYRITLDHANALTQALFDAAVATVLSDSPSNHAQRFLDISGVSDTVSLDDRLGVTRVWYRLSPSMTLLPYNFQDRAERSLFGLCGSSDISWDSEWLVPLCGPRDNEEHHELFGAATVLAFAREVMFQLAKVTGSQPELSTKLTAVMSEVERMTGESTAIRRPSDLSLIQKSDGPVPELVKASSPPLAGPELRIAAKDPSYGSPTGATRAALDALSSVSQDDTEVGTGAVANRTRLTWNNLNYEGETGNVGVVLKYPKQGQPNRYTYISDRNRRGGQGSWPDTVTVATQGWLVDLVQRVTAVQDTNWSRPYYDGFGMPQKWVPPADASLMGGVSGQDSYSYLLQSAKTAAQEATAAVKTAIDGLEEQARDVSALHQAETKASQLAQQDQVALCGNTDCNVSMGKLNFRWKIGTLSADQVDPCESLATTATTKEWGYCLTAAAREFDYKAFPGDVALPQVVISAMKEPGASFPDASGSELGKVLLRQWNAGRLLLDAKEQTGRLCVAYGREMVAASSALEAAEADRVAADAKFDALNAQLELEDANYKIQVQDAKDNAAAAKEQLAFAKKHVLQYCDQNRKYADCGNPFEVGVNKWRDCIWKASTINDPVELADYCLEEHPNDCGRKQGKNEAELTANMRCKDASEALKTAVTAQVDAQSALDVRVGAADVQSAAVAALREEYKLESAAATAKLKADGTQYAARVEQANVQLGAQVGVIQQVAGELMSAVEDLNSLKSKIALSKARADLENDLAQSTYGTNVELRRKYRSYDLWRARALLESARRLASTARRAIEARFVVDLSTLSADQPFVASPAFWADEIYESDLNVPEVVGLSTSTPASDTVYPNKLLDYVGNLERFVQGYGIAYPTSISLPDTEVLSIAGPDRTLESTANATSYLSPDTKGWRFYCANSNTWISHPGIGQYPITNRLSTACNSQPPTRARYGFWLDPWGVIDGSYAAPSYSDRHNVRWRRLAVNLVGTGIRECTKASDLMDCYANPYIRFDLLHAGQSWQTNYGGEWRSLDIPTSRIEAGKALVAEEWLEPVTTSWNMAYVSNVARGELYGRPMAGNYEIIFQITPDVRLDRIERVQLLVEQDYWVRQGNSSGVDSTNFPSSSGSGGASGAGGTSGTGGSNGMGGSTSNGGTGGTSGGGLYGVCTSPSSNNDRTIDNFEDFNKQIGTGDQRLGQWFGVHAGTCSASPGTTDSFVPVSGGANGSLAAGYAAGSGCDAGNWQGGGIGFTLISSLINNVTTVCANYDASRYSGIEFDAKGTGTVRLEVCTSDLADDNCHGYNQTVTSNWAHYSFTWSQLAQNPYWGSQVGALNPAHIKKIQFLSPTANYEFWIDNMAFTN